MKHKTIYLTVLAFSILASLIFGIFMTFSIAQSADATIADINAYSSDKVKYFNLISALFLACLIIVVIFTFVYKNKLTKNFKFQEKPYKFTSILGGCTSAGIALFCVIHEFTANPISSIAVDAKTAEVFYRMLKPTHEGTAVNLPYVAMVLVVALSAGYFFYSVFTKKEKNSDLFAGLSMLPSVALAAKLVFDFLMQNSNGYGQLYNYHLLSLGFILLFSVNESRFYLRKAAPALYVFFGVSGAISAAIFAIPVLFLSLTGVVQATGTNIAFCLADIAMVVYIYARLFSLDVKIPKATKKAIDIEETSEITE